MAFPREPMLIVRELEGAEALAASLAAHARMGGELPARASFAVGDLAIDGAGNYLPQFDYDMP